MCDDCPNELYLFYNDVDYLLTGAKTHSLCVFNMTNNFQGIGNELVHSIAIFDAKVSV